MSAAARTVVALILKFAATSSNVALLGETGVGKEVAAEDLHRCSARASRPFVVVHCGGLARELAWSQLFGHERGAFTGAFNRYAGAFEQAAGGTIFLDEVGELPPEIQVLLLRALEARTFTRLGGTEILNASSRIIVATHRDLAAMVATGLFRADLFYRVAVLRLPIAPLRDRLEDLPLLVRALSSALDLRFEVTPDGIAALAEHDWPGNVRELRNVLENIAAEPRLRIVGAREVRLHGALAERRAPGARTASKTELIDMYLDDPTPCSKPRQFAKEMADRAYERAGDRVAEAAQMMGVSRYAARRLKAQERQGGGT